MIKGKLLPIFCNTHSVRKLKSYVKFIVKNYFFKMFEFLLIFSIDIVTPIISFMQIACDVMCIEHLIQ